VPTCTGARKHVAVIDAESVERAGTHADVVSTLSELGQVHVVGEKLLLLAGNEVLFGTIASFVLAGDLEGGLFKRAQFREGAHTAHGNHRSRTIYRIIIGV
jgi:hypothetical protein